MAQLKLWPRYPGNFAKSKRSRRRAVASVGSSLPHARQGGVPAPPSHNPHALCRSPEGQNRLQRPTASRRSMAQGSEPVPRNDAIRHRTKQCPVPIEWCLILRQYTSLITEPWEREGLTWENAPWLARDDRPSTRSRRKSRYHLSPFPAWPRTPVCNPAVSLSYCTESVVDRWIMPWSFSTPLN
jgi:hypothetical protein